MSVSLIVLTYFAYTFIIAMYSAKLIKIARMPVHLRWELYPMFYDDKNRHGSSHFVDVAQWTKTHRKKVWKGILFLLKENFVFSEYFKSNRSYWLFLQPWHIGFILIIAFHILCFLGALAAIAGVTVSAESTIVAGRIFYYLILLTGVISFIAGSFGSIGLFIKRLTDKDLKVFATPQNYFSYIFTMMVFLSGLYSWVFVDPAFAEYRSFWKGLITLGPVVVEPATAVHIVIFSLFLVYLPFTRSLHYITKFFAYLWIRWDDRPNLRGSKLERNIEEWLDKPVSWSAPHITSGRTWAEIGSEKISDEK